MKGLKLRGMHRGSFLAFLIAVATMGTGAPMPALGQTAEQLEMFNSLDPAQQQSVMQSLGLGQGTVSGAQGTATSTLPRSVGGSTADSRTGAAVRNIERINNRMGFTPDDTLQSDDVLLIEIDFPLESTTLIPATPSRPAQLVTVPARPRAEPLTPADREHLSPLIELVRSKNPYTLGINGTLHLPGFAPMPLGGLNIEQATSRVQAEPAFRDLQIKLTYLPVQKPGAAGLKPYGYDLFNEAPFTFAPVTDVPVPADYVVGPGDELNVQLYGSTNRTSRLKVGNDGTISFPQLGPISVGGRSFEAVRSDIESRVSQQMIGVRASVAMGQTRFIRVFVLGEANLPGSYTVSGLGTMTTALFASGGVKPIGSLRNIQLKRQGTVVRTLDLYDLLQNGDTSNDAKLLPGDVIHIPTVGTTVAVDGEVRRPAIYELKGSQTAADAITLAGGLTAEADTGKVSLTRVDAGRQRVVLPVNLAGGSIPLRNGDELSVARIPPTLDSGITIAGHVHAPRSVAWRDGLRLSDVIASVDELKPNADIHYLLIRRELPPDRRVAVLSADRAGALAARGGAADVVLQARDRITVFDFETDRNRVIKPILDELRLQSQAARPTEVVRVEGRIKVPGEYPLEPGMRIRDLVRAGGSLQDAAFASTAELTRYIERDGKRATELIEIDLAGALAGNEAANIALQSTDLLTIKELPLWSANETVTLRGEVRFPGTYPIQRGETLHSVIQRAGGLTELAFADGSVFTREDLRQREQEQLDMLTERMRSDLASLALQGAQANQTGVAQSLSVGQSLLAQLQSSKAVGRLVIDLEELLAGPERGASDVMLRSGDVLTVPRQRQEVTVLGEVQTTTSHLYRQGQSRNDYISQSGGVTRRADTGQTYVVRANGSVVSAGSRWFSGVDVRPGDTIVVPLDTEKMPALPLWQAVTQIVYNIAIAAAAVNSF